MARVTSVVEEQAIHFTVWLFFLRVLVCEFAAGTVTMSVVCVASCVVAEDGTDLRITRILLDGQLTIDADGENANAKWCRSRR
mmetsp:Transcript_42771/g.72983  ORF Transcript_42771/g.72983 Transcript_42771/m.72983 type:complete len:83 (-) Transcript_42771:239-487(-)